MRERRCGPCGCRRRLTTADLLRAFIAYEQLAGGATMRSTSTTSCARALACLRADAALLARWRARCATLLVDEVQDVDRSQLDLAVLLAGDRRDIFLVGDDDQTIYAWRLADVRRVLDLAAVAARSAARRPGHQLSLPAARRRARRAADRASTASASPRRSAPDPARHGRLRAGAGPGRRAGSSAAAAARSGCRPSRASTPCWRGPTPSWRRSRPSRWSAAFRIARPRTGCARRSAHRRAARRSCRRTLGPSIALARDAKRSAARMLLGWSLPYRTVASCARPSTAPARRRSRAAP